MSKYGSGLTFGKICMMEKEQIKQALRGKLLCGETEKGFEYAPASQEKCEKFILHAYDNVVYHALQSLDHGRAQERLLKEEGIDLLKILEKVGMPRYTQYMMEASEEFDDYRYEGDDEDLDV